MQDGDLATWQSHRIMAVLEGVFCRPERFGLRRRLRPVETWEWQVPPLKSIASYAYNNIPVEVITFLDEEVAEVAAKWFDLYGVEVSDCQYYHYGRFCDSLRWRRIKSVDFIADSDPERLLHYGQLGQQIAWGGMF